MTHLESISLANDAIFYGRKLREEPRHEIQAMCAKCEGTIICTGDTDESVDEMFNRVFSFRRFGRIEYRCIACHPAFYCPECAQDLDKDETYIERTESLFRDFETIRSECCGVEVEEGRCGC